MKKISIGFIIFLCACVMGIGQCLAEDSTASVVDDTSEMSVDDDSSVQADVESVESEGEISYTAQDPFDADITVIEARICEGIRDREPLAPGDVFSGDISSLFCFSRISSSENTEVRHIWYFDGQPMADIPLAIKASSGWRTFSTKTINPVDKGNWRVDIVTADDRIIKTIQFIVN